VPTLQRNTKQKQAIQHVLEHTKAPLLPPEILALAALEVPNMGIATVYRSLKNLVEEGKVHVVEIAGQSPRYESADRGHHHHFLCRVCGKVFDLGKCVPGIKSLAPRKFTVEDHDITLYGRCDKC